MSFPRVAVFRVGSAVLLMQASVIASQPAPIPAQIPSAQKVFIANAGTDQWTYQGPFFLGGPDRPYNQFYAAMKSWGRFELMPAPADADLVIEILFTVTEIPARVVGGGSFGRQFDPEFHLKIRDPKSNALLWGITEHAEWAFLESNREKNFDQALDAVVAQVKRIVTEH